MFQQSASTDRIEIRPTGLAPSLVAIVNVYPSPASHAAACFSSGSSNSDSVDGGLHLIPSQNPGYRVAENTNGMSSRATFRSRQRAVSICIDEGITASPAESSSQPTRENKTKVGPAETDFHAVEFSRAQPVTRSFSRRYIPAAQDSGGLLACLQSAQRVSGCNKIGLEFQRLLVVPDGLGHPAGLDQGIPQVVVRTGEIWAEF